MGKSHQHHITLTLDAERALAHLMERMGLSKNQAFSFAISNAAFGHDGYYMRMAAYQSAIAAAAALFAAQQSCRTEAEGVELVEFSTDLAQMIHGPPPEAPVHLRDRAGHDPIARAFFAALENRYGPR